MALVDLQDPVDDAVEEGPVVGDHRDPAGQRAEEAFQAFEAGEVEIVGRLVEQEHVEAGQQHRRQPGPGRLAAGQVGDGDVGRSAGRPTSAATVPTRASKSSPPRARKRSRASEYASTWRRIVGQGGGQAVELGGGGGHARYAGPGRPAPSRPVRRRAPG